VTTAKPKRPSIISTIGAAIGVTSSDATADEAAPVERVWPSTRAERAAMHNTLLGEAQRAYKVVCDELIEKDQALHRERVLAERLFTDHCAQLASECQALDARDYEAARARAQASLVGLAREWTTEPQRKTAAAIALAIVAHGEELHDLRPGPNVVEHAGVVLAAALCEALGCPPATEHAGRAQDVARAALRRDDAVSLSERLTALEKGILASLRDAREQADQPRVRASRAV